MRQMEGVMNASDLKHRWETFLSYEDPEKDILIGLLRLRKPG